MNKKTKKFWEWKNQVETDSGSERVLEMYGAIAEDAWFDDDITPRMFHDELFAGTGPVTLWISSPGGDCIAASQIYAMLMDYPSDITVKIDGLAASAASVIAMAGTKVLMAPTAMMLIHNPMTSVSGNRSDFEKAIGILDEVKESIINAYEIKTGLSRAKLSHLMDAELPMHVGTAIELGFADGILEDKKKACRDDADANPSVSLAIKIAENAIVNKVKAYESFKEAQKKEDVKEGTASVNETQTEPKPAAPEAAEEQEPEESTPVGTPVSDLEKRLNLLKM